MALFNTTSGTDVQKSFSVVSWPFHTANVSLLRQFDPISPAALCRKIEQLF